MVYQGLNVLVGERLGKSLKGRRRNRKWVPLTAWHKTFKEILYFNHAGQASQVTLMLYELWLRSPDCLWEWRALVLRAEDSLSSIGSVAKHKAPVLFPEAEVVSHNSHICGNDEYVTFFGKMEWWSREWKVPVQVYFIFIVHFQIFSLF